jgi:hypothetical protein
MEIWLFIHKNKAIAFSFTNDNCERIYFKGDDFFFAESSDDWQKNIKYIEDFVKMDLDDLNIKAVYQEKPEAFFLSPFFDAKSFFIYKFSDILKNYCISQKNKFDKKDNELNTELFGQFIFEINDNNSFSLKPSNNNETLFSFSIEAILLSTKNIENINEISNKILIKDSEINSLKSDLENLKSEMRKKELKFNSLNENLSDFFSRNCYFLRVPIKISQPEIIREIKIINIFKNNGDYVSKGDLLIEYGEVSLRNIVKDLLFGLNKSISEGSDGENQQVYKIHARQNGYIFFNQELKPKEVIILKSDLSLGFIYQKGDNLKPIENIEEQERNYKPLINDLIKLNNNIKDFL